MFARWKKNIFLHFALSYVLILLVLLLAMLGVSIQNLTQKQKEAFSVLELTMEQSVNNIEDRFTEFSNLIQNISSDENLLKIQNDPEAGYYSFYKLMQKIQNQAYLNSFADAIYVVLPEQEKIIGSDGIISSTEFFHRVRYGVEQGTYQNWLEGILSSQGNSGRVSLERVRVGSDEQSVILYSQPLATTKFSMEDAGQVFIYVSENRLQNLVVNSGEILEFSIGLPRQKEGKIPLIMGAAQDKCFSLSKTSGSGKTYECLASESAVLKGWYENLLMNISLILLAFLIAAGLCVWFARRNSRPISNIVTSLSAAQEDSFTGKENVYVFIQNQMAKLLEDRNALNQELERRIPLMQAGFVERLLSGTITDYTDLEGQLADLQIHLSGNCYCVAVLQVTNFGTLEDDREGVSAIQMTLESLVRRYAGKNSIIYANEERRVTVILGLDSFEQEAWIRKICRSVMDQMKKYGIRMQAAIGIPYVFLADTFISFAQAKRLLASVHVEDDEVLLTYDSYQAQTTFYYFPTEIEIKLMRVMMSGNWSAVENVFEELERENVEIRKLTPMMMQGLIEELTGTYAKVLSSVNELGVSSEKLRPFFFQHDLGGTDMDLLRVRGRFHELCGLIAGLRDHKSSRLRERICEYLDQRFADPSMNLAMLSEEFAVSEIYMSRLFKEQMATTFSKYLEKIRMNYALSLLKDEKNPINQVAESCGYSSPHAFRRAFKRYWGYLPSESRNK